MDKQAAEFIGAAPGARRDRCVRPRAARPGWIAAVVLALFALPLAGGPALAQCARCGQTNVAPVSAPVAAPVFAPRRTVFARLWSGTTSSEMRPSHQGATRAAAGGSPIAICVRVCDGSFFPVSYASAASRAELVAEVCRSLCPNTDVAPYSFPFGGNASTKLSRRPARPMAVCRTRISSRSSFAPELLLPGARTKLGRSARSRRGPIPAPFARHPCYRRRGGTDVSPRAGKEDAGG